MNLPAGRYRYVKIDRWKDRYINAGQMMYLKDKDDFEVTSKPQGPSLPFGYALNSHRYSQWEYILWRMTRNIKFSPIRYVFIQESGFVQLTGERNG